MFASNFDVRQWAQQVAAFYWPGDHRTQGRPPLPMSRCKIAFLLPNLCLGGAEKVTVHLANGLAARGTRSTWCCSRPGANFSASWTRRCASSISKAGRMMWALPRFAGYLRKDRPAVVISAHDYVNMGVILAKRLSATAVPVVLTIHSTHSDGGRLQAGFRAQPARLLAQWCYRRASRIVCVSQAVADDLAAGAGIGRERLKVIYNPVVKPADSGSRPRTAGCIPGSRQGAAGGAGGGPVVGREGLSDPDPRSPLRRKHEVRLMILGEGNDRPRLESLIAEMGLGASVALPGFAANPYNYMARAALFVLSSISEALPTALIEAMAVGTPVVATDCKCGPKEVLQDGRFGSLVPVGDVAALAEAMAAALSAPRCQLPPDALQPYTMDHAVDEYCRIIDEVTRG